MNHRHMLRPCEKNAPRAPFQPQNRQGAHYENCSHLRQRRNLPAFRPHATIQSLRSRRRKNRASKIIGSNGAGHGALAGLLSQGGIDVLICGGIGGGAINALGQAGIEVYAGAAGSPDAAVEALLAGALPKLGEATCHSDHAHSHSCANHGGTCHQ